MGRADRPPVDAWTLVHVVAGAAVATAGVPAPVALGGAVLYEVFEPTVWPALTGRRSREETANRVVDVAAFALGLAIVQGR